VVEGRRRSAVSALVMDLAGSILVSGGLRQRGSRGYSCRIRLLRSGSLSQVGRDRDVGESIREVRRNHDVRGGLRHCV